MDDPMPLHDAPSDARIDALETLITVLAGRLCNATPGLTAQLRDDVTAEADGLQEVGNTDAATVLRTLWRSVEMSR